MNVPSLVGKFEYFVCLITENEVKKISSPRFYNSMCLFCLLI